MHDFVYRRMQSVDEAATLLQADDEAKLLSGGMTLLPTMKQRLAQPSQLLDLTSINELHGIECTTESITIGAATTHASVAGSKQVQQLVPALATLANGIGDPQVRNRGTLGGSVANADPSADYPAAVLGLQARVSTNQREIAAGDFFVDLFETALEEDELITRIEFSVPKRASYASFRNPASRYAIVGVFVADFGEYYRVAVTGAAGSAFRWTACESALQAAGDDVELRDLPLVDDEFNEDIHASADYRAHLVRVMAGRAVIGL